MVTKRMVLSIVAIIILTSVVVYSADAAGIPKKAISTVSTFLKTDLPASTVFNDQANTFSGANTFNHGINSIMHTNTGVIVANPAGSFSTTLAGGAVSGNITLTLPTSAGTLCTTGTCLTTAVTSATGTAGNVTVSGSTGAVTWNLGSNVVTTGGSAQTVTKSFTLNTGILGGDLNVGSNALTNSGHKSTLPSNTGTLLQANGSGSSLSGIVTSATGTAGNVTVSGSTGAVTWNLGSNVVTTGGSAQTVTKKITLTNPQINGLNTNFTKITASPKTLNYNADTVVVDATSANPTIINLPTASGHQGKLYFIQKNDTSGNIVMIDPSSSEKINGALTLNLTSNLGSAIIQSDGTNWERIDRIADEVNSFRTQGSTINRWYGSATTGLATSTIVSTANQLRAYPFVVPKAITIDKIEMEVSTAANPTTTQCRMALYTEDGNTYPYKLVTGSDFASFTTALGVKTNTFVTPVTLLPGLYFLVHDCESAATTQPTFRGIAVGALPSVLGYTSTMGANQMATAWQVAFTETGGAALPATYPSGGTVQINLINAMILVRIIG